MILNSKYPILVPAMNRVSDIKLAVACHNAGVYPSLSVMSYITTAGRAQFIRLEQDLREFIHLTGTSNLLISLNTRMLQSPVLLQILKNLRLTTLEIIDAYIDSMPVIEKIRQEYEFNIILKMTHPGKLLVTKIDGVVLKGPNGAGTSFDNTGSLPEMVKSFKEQFLDKFVIASGGVSSAEEVKELLDLGASMVGVGTLYAASMESSISEETKLKMINASWSDVEKIKESSQNSIIFKKLDIRDDANNTRSLEVGLRHGYAGHIFAGKAIDKIDSIKTVQEITDILVKEIKHND